MVEVKSKLIEELSEKYKVDYLIVEWIVHRFGARTIAILEKKKTRYAAISMYYAEEALYESIG